MVPPTPKRMVWRILEAPMLLRCSQSPSSVHTHTHTHTHTHAHTHTQTHKHTNTESHKIHIHIYAHVHTHTHSWGFWVIWGAWTWPSHVPSVASSCLAIHKRWCRIPTGRRLCNTWRRRGASLLSRPWCNSSIFFAFSLPLFDWWNGFVFFVS